MISGLQHSTNSLPQNHEHFTFPAHVNIGDPGTALQFAAKLREAGYIEDGRTNVGGWYHRRLRQFHVDQFASEPIRYLPEDAYT